MHGAEMAHANNKTLAGASMYQRQQALSGDGGNWTRVLERPSRHSPGAVDAVVIARLLHSHRHGADKPSHGNVPCSLRDHGRTASLL